MKKLSYLIVMLFMSITLLAQPEASWVSTAGGTSSEYGYKSFTTPSGETYVTGKFKSSSVDFGNGVVLSPVSGNYDIYVAKYNTDGVAQWAVAAGGSSADEGDAITVDENGNVYVTGAFFKTAYFGTDSLVSSYNWDVFVAKLDGATGNWVWVKAGHTPHSQAKGQGLTVLPNGNIVVAGYFGSSGKVDTLTYEGNQIINGGSRNAFVMEITPDGDFVWGTTGGGPAYTYGNEVVNDGEGNIYLCGSYKDTTAEFGTTTLNFVDSYEGFVAKLDGSGNFVWASNFYGPGSDGAYGIDYAENGDKKVVGVAGYFEDTLYVGEDNTLYSAGGKDLVVIGFDAESGHAEGGFSAGGPEGDESGSVIKFIGRDPDLILVGGYSQSNFVFGEDTVVNLGKKDALIVAMDHGKEHALGMGGNSYDYLRGLGYDDAGNVYLFGYFKSNPANFLLDVNSQGSYDLWLSKWPAEGKGVKVTFECDMSVQEQKGSFNPASSQVYVRGSFNGWGETELFDPDADLVYSGDVDGLNPGETVYFKFFYNNPDTWENDPNREYVVPDGGGVYYDFFNRDSVPPMGFSNITFQVDMSIKQQEGTFDPNNSQVSVRGSFNGWGETPMSDVGNYLYEATIDSLSIGETEYFKFFYNNPDTWEGDPNREYVVPDHDAIAGPYFFDRDSVVNITGNGNILFSVDMSVMSEVGIFDLVTDSVQIRGGFNGWSGDDVARSHMMQNPLNPNLYTLNVPFENQPVGDMLEYKFYANLANPGIWTDGWERPTETGGGNRFIEFQAQPDQVADPAYFADVTPGQVITDGQTLSITFSVDMHPAMDSTLQAVPFNPATDTLYWICEQPSFVRTQGWTDTDDMRVLEMTDPDGDGIYTGTLTVNGPSFNSFVYRYGYVSASDGSYIHEPAGFGRFAYRVRYIAMNGPRDFVQPYSAPTDVWTNQEDKSDQWEPNPLSSDVKKTGEIVKHFELEQNYPNPFNPTTTIRFSVPAKELVTLKVFNVLGQEVMTLVNKEMSAGSYKVNFDASNLPTGVYIYKMTAGKFSATKKMILLK